MILLKNVNIKGENIHDVLIENQKIKQIAKPNTINAPDAQTIDLSGKILLPGLVDLHTHLREPGREDSETIESGSKAAVAGGTTSFIDFAIPSKG